MSHLTSRRDFIKIAAGTSLAGSAASAVLHGSAQAPASPNDRIQIATIGIGGQGTYDTKTALLVPGVELVAVADVYDGRLTRAKEVFGSSIQTTRDYREVLARPDVDAVIIGTPDHWHAQVSSGRDECGQGRVLRKADGANSGRRASRDRR